MRDPSAAQGRHWTPVYWGSGAAQPASIDRQQTCTQFGHRGRPAIEVSTQPGEGGRLGLETGRREEAERFLENEMREKEKKLEKNV